MVQKKKKGKFFFVISFEMPYSSKKKIILLF